MLTRLWRGRPRGLNELPPEVKMAQRYGGPAPDYTNDWWLGEANLSTNGKFLRLTFDDKPGVIDYWCQTSTGWVLCSTPTTAELLGAAIHSANTVFEAEELPDVRVHGGEG